MSNQPIQFPSFPTDPESRMNLRRLSEFALALAITPDSTEHLRKCGAYLYLISDSPYKNEYVYFRAHAGLQEEAQKVSNFFNTYVYSRGMDHMIEVINNEAGDFAPFFNDFQYIMYPINERSKQDPAYEPVNTLIWAFYCALFDHKRMERLLDKSISVLEGIKDETHQSMYN